MTTACWDLPRPSWGQGPEENEAVPCEDPCPLLNTLAAGAQGRRPTGHELLEGRAAGPGSRWPQHRAGQHHGPPSVPGGSMKSFPEERERDTEAQGGRGPAQGLTTMSRWRPGLKPRSAPPGPSRAGLDSTESPSSSCARLLVSAGCGNHPGAGPRSQTSGQNNRRQLQGEGLAARVSQGCLLAFASGSFIPKATPHPVTPIPPGWEAGVLGDRSGQLLPGG